MASLFPLTSNFTPPLTTNTSQRAFKTLTNQTHGFRVSSNGKNHNNDNNLLLPNLDRRNLLVGLGGLYTAANLPVAIADPIYVPDDISLCMDADSGFNPDNAVRTDKCCPPNLGKTVNEFVFPVNEPVRMRWPAHAGTPDQVDKYRRAIQKMRDLPEGHPHSFSSQAKIHCAYCNGGYTQVESGSGFPTIDIQIHNSWLFFPFHRWYLYFFERILGKLIDDPTFAMPYWNWDAPAGMPIPEIYLPRDPNALYDENRNPDHVKDMKLVDLDWDGTEKRFPKENQITCNLRTVYRDMIRNGSDPLTFFGGEYRAGDSPVCNNDPSVGSVEAGIHTAVHRWVGHPNKPNHEDMGNFYSAGYDPLFYAHHANVDRMWKIWKGLNPEHSEPTKVDWLEASYVFYDENEQLVRVYNKDSVDLAKLNFNYIESSNALPWLKSRPLKRSKSEQVEPVEAVKSVNQIRFPLHLKNTIKIDVRRPYANRWSKLKEVLVISKIKYDPGVFVRFDVFVNVKVKPDHEVTQCDPEYAGAFTHIPHGNRKMKMFHLSSARFVLDEIFEDTNTEDQGIARVTLVPREGCDDVTIGKMEIALVPAV